MRGSNKMADANSTMLDMTAQQKDWRRNVELENEIGTDDLRMSAAFIPNSIFVTYNPTTLDMITQPEDRRRNVEERNCIDDLQIEMALHTFTSPQQATWKQNEEGNEYLNDPLMSHLLHVHNLTSSQCGVSHIQCIMCQELSE